MKGRAVGKRTARIDVGPYVFLALFGRQDPFLITPLASRVEILQGVANGVNFPVALSALRFFHVGDLQLPGGKLFFREAT